MGRSSPTLLPGSASLLVSPPKAQVTPDPSSLLRLPVLVILTPQELGPAGLLPPSSICEVEGGVCSTGQWQPGTSPCDWGPPLLCSLVGRWRF